MAQHPPSPLPRRRRLAVQPALAPAARHAAAPDRDLLMDGYAPTQMIADLRKYQAELEVQNQALRYSQQEAEGASERFATLFSSVPLALMVVDEDGLVLASNAMALRLFQPQESDPPLNFLLPFVGAAHTDEVAVSFLNARASGASEVHEVGFRCGASGTFTGDLHIARIENPQDELAHFICAIIDQGPLLAQRLALQESAAVLMQRNEDLLQSENRMAAVINSSLDAILCVDEKFCITVFNPAATALFACPSEAALGSRLGLFLPEVEQVLASSHVPGQAMLGEFMGTTLQGERVAVEISVALERRQRERAPLREAPDALAKQGQARQAQGSVTTIFARDLSARKRAESQRMTLESQLRASQKMQAVGTMAGGIAHDFNNILSAILGNAHLASQDTAPDAPAHTSLREIEKAGRRARELVRQILTFSRNEPARRVPLDLVDAVHDTLRLVKVTLAPGIELRVVEPRERITTLADPTQVEQALLNLCTNALLAMGSDKGSLTLEVNHCTLDSPRCEHLGVAPGDYVTLLVHDTGKGMSQATMERMFEPFFTTREVGQGTGLGLSVVHGIMQSHQGGIEVRSAPGQGSTFTLYFPASDAHVEAGSSEPAPLEAVHGGGKRVLYVDDDEALVFLVERVLTRKGFAVTALSDPLAALALLRRDPHSVDLLVTDYNMPGYSGLDLLRAAKAVRPALPVALASGYVTPEIEHAAFAAGASALVHKPNDVSALCETVQRLVQGDAPA